MTPLRRAADHVRDSAYGVTRKIRHLVRPAPANWAEGDDGLAPILLIAGVYETWEFLAPIAERLNALGHPIHVVPGFGDNRGSIPAMAARAQRYLDGADLRGVVVIGHSKGGLIAKHMMVVDDTEGRIDRLIAINTPFGGSSLAKYTIRRALREFTPNSVTLLALARQREVNARILSIRSERDPIIPAGGALVGAANVVLPVFGHFRVLSSPLLFDMVERELGHHPSRVDNG